MQFENVLVIAVHCPFHCVEEEFCQVIKILSCRHLELIFNADLEHLLIAYPKCRRRDLQDVQFLLKFCTQGSLLPPHWVAHDGGLSVHAKFSPILCWGFSRDRERDGDPCWVCRDDEILNSERHWLIVVFVIECLETLVVFSHVRSCAKILT